MICYVREKIMDVLKNAYPDDYQKYSGFYLHMDFKQCTQCARYRYEDRKITVSTLSRKPGAVFLSILLKLAEHIDIRQRSETHYDEIYLGIIRRLLDAALIRGIIQNTDLYSMGEKVVNALQRKYGSFKNWRYQEDIAPDNVYVRVYDAIMIHNILRHNDYKYDADQMCWVKKIVLPDPVEELFIHEYELQADFRVINTNKFIITPVYLINLITYSKDHADYLKSLNYRCDRNQKHYWLKPIYASDYEKEISFLNEVPKQKIFITKNQNKR